MTATETNPFFGSCALLKFSYDMNKSVSQFAAAVYNYFIIYRAGKTKNLWVLEIF